MNSNHKTLDPGKTHRIVQRVDKPAPKSPSLRYSGNANRLVCCFSTAKNMLRLIESIRVALSPVLSHRSSARRSLVDLADQNEDVA